MSRIVVAVFELDAGKHKALIVHCESPKWLESTYAIGQDASAAVDALKRDVNWFVQGLSDIDFQIIR
jgi:hypothetical protein